MVSVLLVQPRQGEAVADAERRDFLQATGLKPQELTSRMLDSTSTRIGSLEGFDGVIVGGSPLNATDFEYSAWQKHVHRELALLVPQPLPTLFVCYGNTFLTFHSGGKVGRTHPESSGPTTVLLTEAGKRDTLTHDLPDTFTSFTGHTENSITPAPGHVVLATGPTCPIQMLRANNSTWSVQFHADMDAVGMKNRMDFYANYGYFSPEDYNRIVASLPSVDAIYANRVLRNFVEVCDGARPMDGSEHSLKPLS
ncbi:glutamine amidotransferase [Corynebacterium deserti GIMN1.010]|uniref:Glutamine amidotransferase n=1 Tax=Corynebacterium deserti GIMN1.010 TaxID=931089 RepID=A0A0M5IG67_9CORY|nr:glutamine amidotransferase [Corynebacterium deserti]ALC05894.1 glutamine amidotransferase [Corynebacterium deserti GIMN1.010]